MPTNEEILKRDKLLLDLMIHAYDEDLARNELVDTKNSQMMFKANVLSRIIQNNYKINV